MKNYDETQCIRALSKKHDCRIHGNLIEVSKDNGDVGKKSWAKIDFLCKRCGYRYMIVSFAGTAIPKKNRKKYEDNYDEDTKPTKNGKTKSNKVNLRKMVNKIMSK